MRGSALDPPLDVFSGHILYINDDDLVLPDLIWEFFQTGTIQQPLRPEVPIAGPVGTMTLALSLAAVGAGRLRRDRNRALDSRT
jgi:hypothetical protein